jgi:hypothetical protein
MSVIMTAHIAQSSNRGGISDLGVIIHALAPVIGPYMSRAMTMIHVQQTSGRAPGNTIAGTVVPQRRLEDGGQPLAVCAATYHRRISR